jgi:hypothetical protein
MHDLSDEVLCERALAGAIAAESLGNQAGQTHRAQEDHGRRGPQARRDPKLHLDRRHRVRLG